MVPSSPFVPCMTGTATSTTANSFLPNKVVFTGAETEFLNQYQLQEDEVCINALPNENEIAAKLSFLIEHPEKIIAISKNARNFIEKQHDYKTIATKYLACWEA